MPTRRAPRKPVARVGDEAPAPVPKAAPATRARSPESAAFEEQRTKILGAIEGFHATHLLAFGQESGAFQQLGNAGPHGMTAAELADRTGWLLDYTRFFLETAYAMGILDLASEAGVTPRARYRFAPHMAALLSDETNPEYVGSVPRLHVMTGLDYRRFPDLFRSGKTFPYALHGEEFLRTAATATRSLPHRFLAEVLPHMPTLRKRLETGAHVLDVGCGAGWALVRLAEEFPKCRILGIDAEPNAIEMAKTLIAFRQLGQRAEARLVRGEEIDYEAEFDLVTFFLVLRSIPPTQKVVALAHAARALKRDGFLLVFDEVYPEAETEFRSDAGRRNVLSQWTEGTWGHRLMTPTQHRTLLAEVGFRVRQEVQVGRYYVLLAEKAAR